MTEPAPDALRRLQEYGRDFTGIAEDIQRWLAAGGTPAGFDALREPFIERYRRLFLPEGAWTAAAPPGGSAASPAWFRWQGASQKLAAHAGAIAADAFCRLTAELASSDPALPPITTLRALHELWIDCGESAYGAAARTGDYAESQAELLSALVEWRAELRAAAR